MSMRVVLDAVGWPQVSAGVVTYPNNNKYWFLRPLGHFREVVASTRMGRYVSCSPLRTLIASNQMVITQIVISIGPAGQRQE